MERKIKLANLILTVYDTLKNPRVGIEPVSLLASLIQDSKELAELVVKENENAKIVVFKQK